MIGFLEIEKKLFAVLEQPFVISTDPTDLLNVKTFLQHNGFKNTKRNDYYSEELGLILEDIHDENVITNSDV